MADAKHTPTPWHAGHDEDGHLVFNSDLSAVVAGTDTDEGNYETEHANAEFIVRAVNSHADLLAACELVIRQHDEVGGTDNDTIYLAGLIAARAAIAKATKGTP